MAEDAWPEDIPIWVDDVQKWMTGLTRRTTCHDVIYALLHARGQLETDSPEQWAVFERWRAVERPLQGRTKIVKVWSAWGAEQPNVQLMVRRLDDYFLPPGAGNSRTRRRHRHSKGQRSKHATTCRCSGGRPQCIRCGKLRALEHVVRHMVRQERRLQELQQRVQSTERQITQHEARQHARRVQQEGRDYVQDSYLDVDGAGDSCSSSSEDPLDAVLLEVGEDRLDDYLLLCDQLYDVTQRLDHTHHVACSLARQIQTFSLSDVTDHAHPSRDEGRAERELESVHVQVTRAVAASVLQQQQELEVARELEYWDKQAQDRSHRLDTLAQQLADIEAASNAKADSQQWDTYCEQSSKDAPSSRQQNNSHSQLFSAGKHAQGNGISLERGVQNGDQTYLEAKADVASAKGLSRPEQRPKHIDFISCNLAQTQNLLTSNVNVHEIPSGMHASTTREYHLESHGRQNPAIWREPSHSTPAAAFTDGRVSKSVSRTNHPSAVSDGEYQSYWRDDGQYQSASDSSTDSGMPGTDGDEHTDVPSPSYGTRTADTNQADHLASYSRNVTDTKHIETLFFRFTANAAGTRQSDLPSLSHSRNTAEKHLPPRLSYYSVADDFTESVGGRWTDITTSRYAVDKKLQDSLGVTPSEMCLSPGEQYDSADAVVPVILKKLPSSSFSNGDVYRSDQGHDLDYSATSYGTSLQNTCRSVDPESVSGCGREVDKPTILAHRTDTLPVPSMNDKRAASNQHVPSLKQVPHARAKCVRFSDELTLCRWREEGDSNSDDTGLSSMHSDDVTPLETLV